MQPSVTYEVRVQASGGVGTFAVDILPANSQVKLRVEVTQGSHHIYSVMAGTELKNFNMQVWQIMDSSSEMSLADVDLGKDVPQTVSFYSFKLTHAILLILIFSSPRTVSKHNDFV